MTDEKILLKAFHLMLALINFALFGINLILMNYCISALNLAASFMFLIVYQIQIEIDNLE